MSTCSCRTWIDGCRCTCPAWKVILLVQEERSIGRKIKKSGRKQSSNMSGFSQEKVCIWSLDGDKGNETWRHNKKNDMSVCDGWRGGVRMQWTRSFLDRVLSRDFLVFLSHCLSYCCTSISHSILSSSNSMNGDVVSYVNVSSVSQEDGGAYRCEARNEAGSVHHEMVVYIQGPPFIKPLGNITVLSGDSLSIRCPVTGFPIQKLVWTKGKQERSISLLAMTMSFTLTQTHALT